MYVCVCVGACFPCLVHYVILRCVVLCVPVFMRQIMFALLPFRDSCKNSVPLVPDSQSFVPLTWFLTSVSWNIMNWNAQTAQMMTSNLCNYFHIFRCGVPTFQCHAVVDFSASLRIVLSSVWMPLAVEVRWEVQKSPNCFCCFRNVSNWALCGGHKRFYRFCLFHVRRCWFFGRRDALHEMHSQCCAMCTRCANALACLVLVALHFKRSPHLSAVVTEKAARLQNAVFVPCIAVFLANRAPQPPIILLCLSCALVFLSIAVLCSGRCSRNGIVALCCSLCRHVCCSHFSPSSRIRIADENVSILFVLECPKRSQECLAGLLWKNF